MPRQATLSLEFGGSPDRPDVVVRNPAAGTHLGPLPVDPAAASAADQRAQSLLEVRLKVPQPNGTPEQLVEALTLLLETADEFAAELFASNVVLEEVRHYCVTALGTHHMSSDQTPLIEIRTPTGYSFPFEMLPFGRAYEMADSTEPPTELAKIFFGFAAIVRRVSLVTAAVGSEVVRQGRLPIALFWDASLEGAKLEEQYFRDRSDAIDAFVWPQAAVSDAEAARVVGRRLRDGRFPEGDQSRSDQIVHFACHCLQEDARSRTLTLRPRMSHAADDAPRRAFAKLHSITSAFSRWSREQARPLVFLNACETANTDDRAVLNFMTMCTKNGHRGVIGTETRIPDAVAARFAEFFYEHLLSGATVAESLYVARWDLLSISNPLGIMYSYYGDPDLRFLQLDSGG